MFGNLQKGMFGNLEKGMFNNLQKCILAPLQQLTEMHVWQLTEMHVWQLTEMHVWQLTERHVWHHEWRWHHERGHATSCCACGGGRGMSASSRHCVGGGTRLRGHWNHKNQTFTNMRQHPNILLGQNLKHGEEIPRFNDDLM